MKWIKEHKIQAISYGILYLFVILFFTVSMPYEVYLPGGIDTAENFVEIENAYESDGSLHESYVSVIRKPTPFQFVLAKFNNKAEINRMSKQENEIPNSQINKSNELYKLSSIYYALFAAYEAADKEITADENGLVIISEYLNFEAYDKLQVGDIIIEINNTPISNFSDTDEPLSKTNCVDPVELTVLRDGKRVTFDVFKTPINENTCWLGISTGNTFTNYENFTATPSFSLVDTSGYGPSAGLIEALSIYNMLVEVDITYGLKIAGTGTIDEDGNVGPIGGIKQKIFGAAEAGVDVYFVPDVDYGQDKEFNNYRDALEAMEIVESDMIIVPVKTLLDAIDYLYENYGSQ